MDNENQVVADRLREMAALLEAQGASPYRAAAYRKAADTVVATPRPLRGIFDAEGVAGLDALPHIGRGIAAAIAELLASGRWSQLERLRGSLDPVQLFQSVPGIGPELARRIHDELHVDTLEALEAAAHDARLERLRGVGARRAAAMRAALASMLNRLRRRAPTAPGAATPQPPVRMLLEVDAEYRAKAAADSLPKIAPRRFNPEGAAWLPVLHARRDAWHFTALYSNTETAHKLGRTRDWVVLYYYDGDHVEGQCTVVTETRGALAGERVVRGREDECRRLHAGSAQEG